MNAYDPYRPAYRGLPPGTRLNGIYEIDEMIGAGGMGEVYRMPRNPDQYADRDQDAVAGNG